MNNRQIIEEQILKKTTSPSVYYPSSQDIYRVRTDMNEFPYRRFFRGRPTVSYPIVWEREAGYSPIVSVKSIPKHYVPEATSGGVCFQTPCTTILPCRSKQSVFSSNQDACVYTSP